MPEDRRILPVKLLKVYTGGKTNFIIRFLMPEQEMIRAGRSIF